MAHGEVKVNGINYQSIDYVSPGFGRAKRSYRCNLISGLNDSYESWIKVGHVNLIADRLVAEGRIYPVSFYCLQASYREGETLPAFYSGNFTSWVEGRKEIERTLLRYFGTKNVTPEDAKVAEKYLFMTGN